MKDELQLKLVEILSSIQATAGKAGDFAMEQLPEIAQSYVIYGRAVAIAKLAVFLLLGVLGIAFALWAYRNPWNTSPYLSERGQKRSESNFFAMGVPGACGFIFVSTALLNFDYLVWFAPKVWLLKEIATLIK